ncbi:hypothetical protein KEM52_000620 [Ascosphaera acerosa]|nr:hypothetical protein KEM52_000620 [Ascosphaera acerosa]
MIRWSMGLEQEEEEEEELLDEAEAEEGSNSDNGSASASASEPEYEYYQDPSMDDDWNIDRWVRWTMTRQRNDFINEQIQQLNVIYEEEFVAKRRSQDRATEADVDAAEGRDDSLTYAQIPYHAHLYGEHHARRELRQAALATLSSLDALTTEAIENNEVR